MNKDESYHLPGEVDVVNVPARQLFELYQEKCGEHRIPVEVRDLAGEAPGTVWNYDGKFELWCPNQGCLVAILDFSVHKAFTTITPLENFFTLEVIVQGHSEVHIGERSISNNGLPRIYLASHGSDSFKKRIHKVGDTYRTVGIWISPRDFLDTFGVDVNQLPDHVQAVLTSPDSGVVTLPMTNPVKQVAIEIMECPFQGKRAEQYLKAKLTELLCHISELANTPASNVVEEVSLTRNKANILKKLLLALEQSRYLPLSLGDIAEELGLCANTLSSVFKEGYGMKLSEYLLQRRMESARGLLQTGRYSVLEAALEVGYENQSSFGRAYRQYFDRTPREDIPTS